MFGEVSLTLPSRGAQLLLDTAHRRLRHPDARLRIVDPSPALGGVQPAPA